MKFIYSVVILTLLFFQSCEKNIDYSNKNNDTTPIVQIGVLKYLDTGAFGGILPINISLYFGDFGLATLAGLNGEVTILNNKIFKLDSSGTVLDITNTNDSTPYSTVTFFKTDLSKIYPNPISLTDLEHNLDSLLTDTAKIYAIKIYGNFDSLNTRTYFKIYPPYPTLTVARLKQVEFNYTNVRGTAVGFWYPPSLINFNHPGYHFHFIGDDLKSAGHILNAKLNNVTVSIGVYKSFGVLKY